MILDVAGELDQRQDPGRLGQPLHFRQELPIAEDQERHGRQCAAEGGQRADHHLQALLLQHVADKGETIWRGRGPRQPANTLDVRPHRDHELGSSRPRPIARAPGGLDRRRDVPDQVGSPTCQAVDRAICPVENGIGEAARNVID